MCGLDALECAHCGGRMTAMAVVEDPEQVARHRELDGTSTASMWTPARGGEIAPGRRAQQLGRPYAFLGNVLGITALALPMGAADGHPTGILVYVDQGREDFCLEVGELLERDVEMPTPIHPAGA